MQVALIRSCSICCAAQPPGCKSCGIGCCCGHLEGFPAAVRLCKAGAPRGGERAGVGVPRHGWEQQCFRAAALTHCRWVRPRGILLLQCWRLLPAGALCRQPCDAKAPLCWYTEGNCWPRGCVAALFHPGPRSWQQTASPYCAHCAPCRGGGLCPQLRATPIALIISVGLIINPTLAPK